MGGRGGSSGFGGGRRTVVNGSDISGTWQFNMNSADFAIEQVLHAQGFDGLPRVVNADEFDQLYTGEQPLLLRTFSAPDKETLDAYQDMLENGKWYVDCSNGGAQYGQGMYTAGIYGDKGSNKAQKAYDGALEEMQHYQTIDGRGNMQSKINTMTLDKSANIVDYTTLTKSPEFKAAQKEHQRMLNGRCNKELYEEYSRLVKESDISSEYKASLQKQLDAVHQKAAKSFNSGKNPKLDGYDEIGKEFKARKWGYTGSMSDGSSYYDWTRQFSTTTRRGNSVIYGNRFTESPSSESIRSIYARNTAGSGYAGVFAASKGYDAINAKGHGKSGSYTVVLNRTKLIIKKGE